MTKRSYSSQSVKLGANLLKATAVMAPLALGACIDEGSSSIYKDIDACVADKVFTREYCEQAYKDAKQQHSSRAPLYEDKADCEKDWGTESCETTKPADDRKAHGSGGATTIVHGGGGTGYSPHMNSYWAGNVSSSTPDAKATSSKFSYPVYKSADGYVSPMTEQEFGSSGRVYSRPNPTTVREVAVTPRSTFSSGTSFASRPSSVGGFGSVGRGFAATSAG